MSRQPRTDALLVLPRLQIQNANAITSPLTHGFPAITAFLGLATALERRYAASHAVRFGSVGVVCHGYQELVNDNPFQRSFSLTRNPLTSSGKTAALVEEGRIHLDISLIFGLQFDDSYGQAERDKPAFAAEVLDQLQQMRIAGGSVLPSGRSTRHRPLLEETPDTAHELRVYIRKLRRRLLPGFALLNGHDILQRQFAAMCKQDPSASLLDAWLHLSRFNWSTVRDADGQPVTQNGKTQWAHDRTDGWIVPIPVGFGALSELHPPGSVANARDPGIHARFVESLYSIGRWVSPHRLTSWEQLLWYREYDPENGAYLARNNYQPNRITTDSELETEIEQ